MTTSELSSNLAWKPIKGLEAIPSPGLLVDGDRVTANIEAMIEMVGKNNIARLRPHVKTHKMPQAVRLQLAAGITKFKAATIAEAKMVADSGGQDVLIAYQMVGPNVDRLGRLIDRYPGTSFATITDNISVAQTLSDQLGSKDRPLRLFIDVDCGMHRTGIPLGDSMYELRNKIETLSGVEYAGLHVYDGHSHAPSLQQRSTETSQLIAEIRRYDQTNQSPTIVVGGSPTFAIWAGSSDWECSPGTPIFWDHGYAEKYPELPFSIAIAVLTRVISKPGANRICLDLGYKSVASENELSKRLSIPAIDDAVLVAHSEEHLVLETDRSAEIALGQAFLAIPRHVCPTVSLYQHATVVRGGRATSETWQVTARDRSLV